MSKAPPIPPEQKARKNDKPDVSGAHEHPAGAASHVDENPSLEGQSANTFQNAPRWGKTQDR
jgi:hypothetical protein